MEISTLDGQRVTIRPEGGALRLSIEGEAGEWGAWLSAQPHDASDVLRRLRKCFAAVEDAADELAIALYEDELARDHCHASLEAALAAGVKPSHCEHCGCELTPENSYESRPGIKGCRQCRGEQNVYWRKEHGLAWR